MGGFAYVFHQPLKDAIFLIMVAVADCDPPGMTPDAGRPGTGSTGVPWPV
jgi:hypothetical protein